MKFVEYKKGVTRPVESTKDSVYHIQEYYIKDISELIENMHCRCELVSCGITKKLSTAKAMIQRRHAQFRDMVEKINSLIFFKFSELNYNKFTSPHTWAGDTIQHWSTDFLGKAIEHCHIQAYKGRQNRKNRFNIGDKVGVLVPFKTEVFLGEITELPPSIEDVYKFREQYREQLKFTGDRFSESEVLSSDNYPKEVYTVRIKDVNLGTDEIVKIGTWLLIPLSNV